jgi:hypothetical protein
MQLAYGFSIAIKAGAKEIGDYCSPQPFTISADGCCPISGAEPEP